MNTNFEKLSFICNHWVNGQQLCDDWFSPEVTDEELKSVVFLRTPLDLGFRYLFYQYMNFLLYLNNTHALACKSAIKFNPEKVTRRLEAGFAGYYKLIHGICRQRRIYVVHFNIIKK